MTADNSGGWTQGVIIKPRDPSESILQSQQDVKPVFMIVALLLTQKATYKDDFSTLVGYGISLLFSTATWYFLAQVHMAYYHEIAKPCITLNQRTSNNPNNASGSITFKDRKEKPTIVHHLAWLPRDR